MKLVVDIYKLTNSFPAEEKYGLVSQMNRAAISIPSNIAEGAGRNSDKDFSHFISMSIGSMNELQTQLILSERLGLVDSDRSREIQATLDNLQRMAIAFKTKLDNIWQRSNPTAEGALTSDSEAIQQPKALQLPTAKRSDSEAV